MHSKKKNIGNILAAAVPAYELGEGVGGGVILFGKGPGYWGLPRYQLGPGLQSPARGFRAFQHSRNHFRDEWKLCI